MPEETERKKMVHLNAEGQPVNPDNPGATETITEEEARRRELPGYQSFLGAGRPKEKR